MLPLAHSNYGLNRSINKDAMRIHPVVNLSLFLLLPICSRFMNKRKGRMDVDTYRDGSSAANPGSYDGDDAAAVKRNW